MNVLLDAFVFIGISYWHLPFISDPKLIDATYGCWVNLTIGFVFTVILSRVWMRIVHFKVEVKGKK